MRKIIIMMVVMFVICSSSLLSARSKKADKLHYGLLPIRSVNIDDGYQKAIEYLVIIDIQKRGQRIKQLTDTCEADDAKCLAELLAKNNVEFILSLDVVGFEKEVSAAINMIDEDSLLSPRRAQLNFDKDELEISIPRLTTSVIENKDISKTMTTQNITDGEVNSEKYVDAKGYAGVAIGEVFSVYGFHLHNRMLTLQWEYGRRWGKYSLGARNGFAFDPKGRAYAFYLVDLLGRYHFTDKNIAPFVGALAGIHYEHRKVEKAHQGRWGFAAGASGGVTFFRNYKMQLPIEVRYQHSFIEGVDTNEIAITVGINF